MSDAPLAPAGTTAVVEPAERRAVPWDGAMRAREWALLAVGVGLIGLLLTPSSWLLFAWGIAAAFAVRSTDLSRNRKMVLIVAAMAGFVAARQAFRPPPVGGVLWEGYGITGFFMLRCIDFAVSKRQKGPGRSLRDRIGAGVLYVVFPPTLVAGPVLTFRDFARSFAGRTTDLAKEAPALITRITLGAVKVYLVAAIIRRVNTDLLRAVFAGVTPQWLPLELPVQVLVLGSMVCTFLVIYVAFSGFSDLAIATARLLGFHLYENLDRPLESRTPAEFWTRWNVSTYRWLMTHVFYPYWGHRQVTAKILTTFAASAAWHAAAVRILTVDSTVHMFLAMGINCLGVLLTVRLAGSRMASWASKDRGPGWRTAGQVAGTGATILFMILVFQFFAAGLSGHSLDETLRLFHALLFGSSS